MNDERRMEVQEETTFGSTPDDGVDVSAFAPDELTVKPDHEAFELSLVFEGPDSKKLAAQLEANRDQVIAAVAAAVREAVKPIAKPKKKKRSPSRRDRWEDATAQVADALSKAEEAKGIIDGAKSELEDLRSEYEDWRSNLPENLDASALAEKLDAVADFDLDGLDGFEEAVDEVSSVLSELEGADLPMGFGRD